jgi:hypothetical protein
MWALVTALAAVGGLVVLACHEKDEPSIKPALEKLKLARLARLPTSRLSLDEAEDGVVLSRRLGEKDLEKRFAAVAFALRKQRRKV